MTKDLDAACPECTAACNFEAMHWCHFQLREGCPVIQRGPERFAGPNGAFEFLPAPGGRDGYIKAEGGQ